MTAIESAREEGAAEDDDIGRIQSDLASVEESLNNHQMVGESFRQSIGSSILSLRNRLTRFLNEPSPVSEVASRSPNPDEETLGADPRELRHRLEDAETAHSNRMPLFLVQQQRSLSERDALRDSAMEQEEMKQQRRSSTLYASRSRKELLEEQDKISIMEELPEISMSMEEPNEPMGMNLEGEDEEEQENADEVPLLLNNQTKERLHKSLDRSGLTRSTSQTSVKVTLASQVYSWGRDISLHEDKTEGASLDAIVSDSSALVSPTARVSKHTIVSAAASSTTAAIVTSAGEVLIAGRNDHGQVDPLREDKFIPKPSHVESLSRARILQISCGRHHTAALTDSGSVLTWGSNEHGQLGHKDTSPSKKRSPSGMVLGAGRKAAAVACGNYFTMVLTTRMSLLICGSSDVAPHGPGHLPSTISVLAGVPIAHISAGGNHAVVVSCHGTAYAWGENSTGCCGRSYPTSLSVPLPIHVPTSRYIASDKNVFFSSWSKWDGDDEPASISDDVAISNAACGENFTIFLTRSGRLLVCGDNSGNQLGLAPRECFKQLQEVLHPKGKRFVAGEAGGAHAVLLDSEGSTWRTGYSSVCLQPILVGQHVRLVAAGGEQIIAVSSPPSVIPANDSMSQSEKEVSDAIMLVHSIEGLLSEKETISSSTLPLTSQTLELFRHPSVLNSLFLSPSECETFYSQLFSVESEDLVQSLAKAIEMGISKGVEAMRSREARTIFPESVRCLLLYLQNPLFRILQDEVLKFDYRGDLIYNLCEACLNLPFEGYKALMTWASNIYTREEFKNFLLNPLLKQLERGFKDAGGARTRALPVIAMLLRGFQKSSQRLDGPAQPSDFYSEFLDQISPEILYEDLMRHKKAITTGNNSGFCICAFPLLMSPSCKRSLLQMEHQIDMFRAATSQLTWDPQNRQFSFEPYFVLAIDRKYLLQQTLQKIGSATPNELRKSLKIVFKGEDGVDAGGVRKEFFQLLCMQLFDVNTGMWSTQSRDVTWFNSDCSWNDDGYYLVGILVGLALYNDVILDVHFPTALYRKLLGQSLGLEDMFDLEVKKGLQQLLDYEGDDLEDVFCLTFDVAWHSLGHEKRVELKEGGSNIPVTQANKEEYVLLYVKWILVDSIKSQYDLFEKGVLQVLEGSSLDLLEPKELELLVVGVPDLDFEALRNNTEYEGGYSKESPTIRNLWKFIETADREILLHFLRFCTGSGKAPIGGLGNLPFKVQRAGPDSNQLPTSHTCFNTLLLPDYGENYEKLKKLLGLAIQNCEGFGLQ